MLLEVVVEVEVGASYVRTVVARMTVVGQGQGMTLMKVDQDEEISR